MVMLCFRYLLEDSQACRRQIPDSLFTNSEDSSDRLNKGLADNGENNILIPESYALAQIYPHPFNPSTTIQFDLKQAGLVTLKVYNSVGQEIATLVNGQLSAGRHSAIFNATGLPSGIYFYRLSVNGYSEVKKMELIK